MQWCEKHCYLDFTPCPQCNADEIAALKSLLTRCQKFFDSMRYVDKYHALYGEDDSVEQIEVDIKAIMEEEGK